MARLKINRRQYPTLAKYATPVFKPRRKVIGRQEHIRIIEEYLDRPEYSNVILLGDAGAGKTAIVDELAQEDHTRSYYEIDLDRMATSKGTGGGSGSVEMATRIKDLMRDVVKYQKHHRKEIVLFMDEFHLLKQVSPAAANAIKPMLARSGALKIRIIAATTFDEFHRYIVPDQALTERLQRVTVDEPGPKVVLAILQSMKKRYVPNAIVAPGLFGRIVRITNQYLPAQSQPRKAIKVFDAMIGAYRAHKIPLDERSLNREMMIGYDIRVDWNVNVPKLRNYLDNRVLDQKDATYILTQRLYMSIANLTDHHKPQGSFLFTGSTGVGKTEMAKALTHGLLGSDRKMIRFDMANYHLDSTENQFRDELTEAVTNHSNWVILLDEIDKASPAITRMLLPVLDEGKIADANDRMVSFRNTYIIATTNAAQEVYKQMQKFMHNGTISDTRKTNGNWAADYRNLIEESLISDKQFPTELINRFDDFIPFKPLSAVTLRKIVLLRLRELFNKVYKMYGIKLHFAGDDPTRCLNKSGEIVNYVGRQPNPHPLLCGVISFLVNEKLNTSTDAGGARGVKRKIDQDITAKVSQLICNDPHVHDIAVRRVGKMALNHPNDRVGNACIVVSPYQPTHHAEPTTRLEAERKGVY